MNKNQMEMLSVKNAIERMVQNYISTFTTYGTSKDFFSAVEHLVAAFFVGQQIDNNYLVRSCVTGDLEISFSAMGHCTRLTFLLPEKLQWKMKLPESAFNKKGAGVEMPIYKEYEGKDKGWKTRTQQMVEMAKMKAKTSPSLSPQCVREGDVRRTPTGDVETFLWGQWKVLSGPRSDIATLDFKDINLSIAEQPETFDPVKAYERAKKAVQNMM